MHQRRSLIIFTDLIEGHGALLNFSGKYQLIIAAQTVPEGFSAGDSITVNGVRPTVISFAAQFFMADVMPETLRRSNLDMPRAKSQVNLERALPVNGRLDGYSVSGHIGGTSELFGTHRENNALLFPIRTAPATLQNIVEKGFVAIDGISLTVASVDENQFSISVIPHTAVVTTLAAKRPGDKLNLETDLLGKYVLRALSLAGEDGTGKRSRINGEWLRKPGYQNRSPQ